MIKQSTSLSERDSHKAAILFCFGCANSIKIKWLAAQLLTEKDCAMQPDNYEWGAAYQNHDKRHVYLPNKYLVYLSLDCKKQEWTEKHPTSCIWLGGQVI